jgi:hypothetical protein
VYDLAFARWVGDEFDLWSERIAPLMPTVLVEPAGFTEQWGCQIPDGTDPKAIQVAVFMRDAAGNRWRLRPGGHYDKREPGLPFWSSPFSCGPGL